MAALQTVVDLLRATNLTAVVESLVRMNLHFPEVDMVKVEEGSDATKDLRAI
jgi:hypothetical protein